MTRRIKAVCFGVGVIGSAVARTICEKKGWIDIVGAIDIDSNKVGKDLGEVIDLGKKLNVSISSNLDKVLNDTRPDVVIHTTSSYLSKVYPELERIVLNDVNIISSCEELSFPYHKEPKLAEQLDLLAKRHDVSILGTGINPGFLMDVLPLVLTTPCVEIEKISVARRMNAASRRIPFQKKIGAGLSRDEFASAVSTKKISGHVGLEQSISIVANALGWDLDRIVVEEPKPMVLEDWVQSAWIRIPPGMVAGLEQRAVGIVNGRELLEYNFIAYIGSPEEYDRIEITGTPNIRFSSSPCVNGDQGTIALLINMIPRVIDSPPGLLSAKDLTLPFATLAGPKSMMSVA